MCGHCKSREGMWDGAAGKPSFMEEWDSVLPLADEREVQMQGTANPDITDELTSLWASIRLFLSFSPSWFSFCPLQFPWLLHRREERFWAFIVSNLLPQLKQEVWGGGMYLKFKVSFVSLHFQHIVLESKWGNFKKKGQGRADMPPAPALRRWRHILYPGASVSGQTRPGTTYKAEVKEPLKDPSRRVERSSHHPREMPWRKSVRKTHISRPFSQKR